MANRELVIKIDENEYNNLIKRAHENISALSHVDKMILHGTLLPKGHGKLIDADYLLNLLKCEEYESCTWRNCSDCNKEKCIRRHDILEAPTIIEADNEVEK